MAPAWPPSLLYITNTYFRQQQANQGRDTDCLQYLKSDIVFYQQQNSFDRSIVDRKRVFSNHNIRFQI
jgi:hypothetical protein